MERAARVASPRTTSQRRVSPRSIARERVLRVGDVEVAQERVAGAEREHAERRRASSRSCGKEAVDHLVAGAVAADREEAARSPRAHASRASSVASPGARVSRTSSSRPARAQPRRAPAGARLPHRPPPARRVHDRVSSAVMLAQARHLLGRVAALAQRLGERCALDLHRRGARERLVPEEHAASALEVGQPPVLAASCASTRRSRAPRTPLPSLRRITAMRCSSLELPRRGQTKSAAKTASSSHRQLLEGALDVLGVDVLAAGGDDHVLAAPDEVQVVRRVDPARGRRCAASRPR